MRYNELVSARHSRRLMRRINMGIFYNKGWRKEYFLITPEEFRDVFSGLHFVVNNTGVKKDYIETLPEDIFLQYETVYNTLKSGRELDTKKDWPVWQFSTGVTAHMENMIYQAASKRSIPAFLEPCIDLSLFPLIPFREKLEKSFWVGQFPNHICGVLMEFPKTVVYEDGSERSSLADLETWDLLLRKIKAATTLLKLETENGIKNTRIRVSDKARQDLLHFRVMQELGVKIISK